MRSASLIAILCAACGSPTSGGDLSLGDLSLALDFGARDDLPAAGAPTLGIAAIAQRINASGPTSGTLTTAAATTQATGSIFLVSLARGVWAAAANPPSDNKSNAYAQSGATNHYLDWPGSATALYSAVAGQGGAGHTFSMAWGDAGGSGDETTVTAVEVTGATTIVDSAWVERAHANTLTSAPVVTTGPALLVAWWWGSGGVLPVGQSHTAVPGNGFSLVPGATGLVSLSTNGYVQVAVATRTVTAAGSYTATWTTADEGAQLYLVALQ